MDDDKIKELLEAFQDAKMSSLDESKMDGYDHEFSDHFHKRMKRMLNTSRYFGKRLRFGYAMKKVAVVAIIILSMAAAATVSARVFDFRPWENLPFIDTHDKYDIEDDNNAYKTDKKPDKNDKKENSDKKQKKKNSLVSLRIINNHVIRIKLNRFEKLSKSDVKVSVKRGTTIRKPAISDISADGVTYTITLSAYEDGSTPLTPGDEISVTVDKLTGRNKLIKIYYDEIRPEKVYISGRIGENIGGGTPVRIDFSRWTKGTCTFSTDGLPDGIRMKKYKKHVELSGSVDHEMIREKTLITATDSHHHRVVRTVLFYFGDEDALIAYTDTEARIALSGDETEDIFPIRAIGGDGDYTYALEDGVDRDVFSIDAQGIHVSPLAKPGKYQVRYTVTDGSGYVMASFVHIRIQKAVKVYGTIKDKNGTPLADGSVVFKLNRDKHKYLSSAFTAHMIGQSGKYVAYLPPKHSYIATVSGDGASKKYYDFTVKKKKLRKNFKLPVKVKKKDKPKGDSTPTSTTDPPMMTATPDDTPIPDDTETEDAPH